MSEVAIESIRMGVLGETSEGRKTLFYKRELNHPAEKVWRAITEHDELQTWFPELTLDHKVGGTATMDFSRGECPPNEANPGDVDVCEITAFDPPELFEYSSKLGAMRWEIAAQGNACTLTLLCTLPAGARIQNSVACGWHYKLDALEMSVDGIEFDLEDFAGPKLTQLYFLYRALDR